MALAQLDPILIPRISKNLKNFEFVIGEIQSLKIPFIAQRAENWCWAACAQMLQEGLHKPVLQQCEMARIRAAAENPGMHVRCCEKPISSECDKGCFPETIYSRLGIQVTRQESSLSAEALDAELRAGRPVQVYQLLGGTTGHVVLVIGRTAAGYYHVLDPREGTLMRQYSELLAPSGDGQWRLSYTGIH